VNNAFIPNFRTKINLTLLEATVVDKA